MLRESSRDGGFRVGGQGQAVDGHSAGEDVGVLMKTPNRRGRVLGGQGAKVRAGRGKGAGTADMVGITDTVGWGELREFVRAELRGWGEPRGCGSGT